MLEISSGESLFSCHMIYWMCSVRKNETADPPKAHDDKMAKKKKKKITAAEKRRRRWIFLLSAILIVTVFAGIIYPYYSEHGCSTLSQDIQNILSTASAMISENPVVTPEPNLYGPYRVRWVVDGDTIVVDLNGTDTYIRLIGIDTPESVSYNLSENTEEGKTAAEFTKKLLRKKKVYLEYDRDTKDKYGRTLAYVFLEDKATMANREILRAGMAKVYSFKPNVKYEREFINIQNEARMNQIGLWGTYYH